MKNGPLKREVVLILLRLTILLSTASFLASCSCSTRLCSQLEEPPVEGDFKFLKEGFSATSDTSAYPVYQTKSPGRPILLLHELPGLTPGLLHLALEMECKGYRVYCPLLFGEFGQHGLGTFKTISQVRKTSRWKLFSRKDPGPIRLDAEEMVRQIAAQHPGQEIMVVGNCLTGSLPADLLALPEVTIAVCCQPAVPMKLLPWGGVRWPIDEARIDSVVQGLGQGKRILFVHYAGDRVAPLKRSVRFALDLEWHHGNAEPFDFVIAVEKDQKENLLRQFSDSALREKIRWVEVPSEGRGQAGHSTLTGAPPGQRGIFRTAFWDALSGTAQTTYYTNQ